MKLLPVLSQALWGNLASDARRICREGDDGARSKSHDGLSRSRRPYRPAHAPPTPDTPERGHRVSLRPTSGGSPSHPMPRVPCPERSAAEPVWAGVVARAQQHDLPDPRGNRSVRSVVDKGGARNGRRASARPPAIDVAAHQLAPPAARRVRRRRATAHRRTRARRDRRCAESRVGARLPARGKSRSARASMESLECPGRMLRCPHRLARRPPDEATRYRRAHNHGTPTTRAFHLARTPGAWCAPSVDAQGGRTSWRVSRLAWLPTSRQMATCRQRARRRSIADPRTALGGWRESCTE
jgi:hypothetical protein